VIVVAISNDDVDVQEDLCLGAWVINFVGGDDFRSDKAKHYRLATSAGVGQDLQTESGLSASSAWSGDHSAQGNAAPEISGVRLDDPPAWAEISPQLCPVWLRGCVLAGLSSALRRQTTDPGCGGACWATSTDVQFGEGCEPGDSGVLLCVCERLGQQRDVQETGQVHGRVADRGNGLDGPVKGGKKSASDGWNDRDCDVANVGDVGDQAAMARVGDCGDGGGALALDLDHAPSPAPALVLEKYQKTDSQQQQRQARWIDVKQSCLNHFGRGASGLGRCGSGHLALQHHLDGGVLKLPMNPWRHKNRV
jgi:hypothetical protein